MHTIICREREKSISVDFMCEHMQCIFSFSAGVQSLVCFHKCANGSVVHLAAMQCGAMLLM